MAIFSVNCEKVVIRFSVREQYEDVMRATRANFGLENGRLVDQNNVTVITNRDFVDEAKFVFVGGKALGKWCSSKKDDLSR